MFHGAVREYIYVIVYFTINIKVASVVYKSNNTNSILKNVYLFNYLILNSKINVCIDR